MPSASDAFAPHADMWVIEPRQHSTFARLRELWSYRYLWWYFASVNVTSLYRRSALGWLRDLMQLPPAFEGVRSYKVVVEGNEINVEI